MVLQKVLGFFAPLLYLYTKLFSATEGITQIKRVPRNRKRTRRYSSSEDDSELCHSRHQQVSINKNNRNDAKNVPEMEEDQSIEALELQLRRQTETTDQNPVAQSRTVQQIRADNLLNSDIETIPLDGFRESDVQQDLEKRQWYEDYLAKAEEDLELNVSCNECDIDDSCLPSDFYAKRDFIYICNLSQKSGVPQAWRGAKKVAALLKKMFGGNPKVVHPVPRWLMLKVCISSIVQEARPLLVIKSHITITMY